MNLVECGQDCLYQQDGYCTREGAAAPSARVDGCCYFEKREK